MCGIVGYVGRRPGKPIILDGLRRLEYRGYDSAGIALIEPGGIDTVRAVGNLDELYRAAGEDGSPSTCGLGHTRWATHGRPSEENAHPHSDCTGRISIVLNGIVENYKDLRARLSERGHTFTQRDRRRGRGPPHRGARRPVPRGRGARRRSPRWRGTTPSCAMSVRRARHRSSARGRRRRSWWAIGEDEMFFASAIPAFLCHTRRVVVLDDGDIVTLRADGAEYTDVAGNALTREEIEFPGDDDAAEKAGFETFMLKEIHEQPAALRDTLAGRLREDGTVDLSRGRGLGDEFLRRLRRIFIVACGTSYHAGPHRAATRSSSWPACRCRSTSPASSATAEPVFDPDTLVIGITQSGETADTLAAMRLAQRGRLAGARAHQHHGQPGHARRRLRPVHARRPGDRRGGDQDAHLPRSPPSCSSRCASLGRAAHEPRPSSSGSGTSCARCPSWPSSCSPARAPIEQIARRYHDERFFLYLGRGMGFAVCLEGALKLKEISYIPTEAYAAGEMKHGPIALLDNESPVVVVADDGPVFGKLVSNIEEVRARGADVIAVATDGNEAIGELSKRRALGAEDRPPPGADPHGDPAAVAGLPHRRHQGTERRPAAEPGQDRDGGVGQASARSHAVVTGVVLELGQAEGLEEWRHVHAEAAAPPF